MKGLLALLTSLLFAGCSQPQKNLANRLKDADRVIFSSISETSGVTINGLEVSRIVQALANARKIDPEGLACSPDSRLDFFKGREHLVSITNCAMVFWLGSTPYHDKSGTLQNLLTR